MTNAIQILTLFLISFIDCGCTLSPLAGERDRISKMNPENPLKHRAIVCIICDRFIIGTEAIHKLTKEQILLHERRLSVASYEEYYETKLKSELTKQYEVNDLKGMLLSPRSRRYCNGYATCTVCNSAMQNSMASKKTPPKFAIANGFVIGSFPC